MPPAQLVWLCAPQGWKSGRKESRHRYWNFNSSLLQKPEWHTVNDRLKRSGFPPWEFAFEHRLRNSKFPLWDSAKSDDLPEGWRSHDGVNCAAGHVVGCAIIGGAQYATDALGLKTPEHRVLAKGAAETFKSRLVCHRVAYTFAISSFAWAGSPTQSSAPVLAPCPVGRSRPGRGDGGGLTNKDVRSELFHTDDDSVSEWMQLPCARVSTMSQTPLGTAAEALTDLQDSCGFKVVVTSVCWKVWPPI